VNILLKLVPKTLAHVDHFSIVNTAYGNAHFGMKPSDITCETVSLDQPNVMMGKKKLTSTWVARSFTSNIKQHEFEGRWAIHPTRDVAKHLALPANSSTSQSAACETKRNKTMSSNVKNVKLPC